MVDLKVELVGAEEGSPSCEDGVGDLEDAGVDFGIGAREAADNFLEVPLLAPCSVAREKAAYLGQGLPPSPEVRVGNDTDGVAQLSLDARRAVDHQANEALLNDRDLLFRELVVAFFVLQGICSASRCGARRWQSGGRTT